MVRVGNQCAECEKQQQQQLGTCCNLYVVEPKQTIYTVVCNAAAFRNPAVVVVFPSQFRIFSTAAIPPRSQEGRPPPRPSPTSHRCTRTPGDCCRRTRVNAVLPRRHLHALPPLEYPRSANAALEVIPVVGVMCVRTTGIFRAG